MSARATCLRLAWTGAVAATLGCSTGSAGNADAARDPVAARPTPAPDATDPRDASLRAPLAPPDAGDPPHARPPLSAPADAITDVPPAPADASGPPREPPPPSQRTQFVLLSIDTTPSYQRPRSREVYASLLRAINRGRDPAAAPCSFTLFIASGGLQFAPDRTGLTAEELPFRGVEPRLAPVYRYAERLDRILDKAHNIRELDQLGVEIASHGVRHLHGGGWTREQWRHELDDHRRILALAGLPQPAGFRAPFLEGNDALYAVLEELGLRYDSSQVGGRCWPSRHPGTRIWVFGVPSVVLRGGRTALLYDDNLELLLRRAAAEAGVEGEAQLRDWIDDEFLAAGLREFLARYDGARAPFLVSGHGGFRRPAVRLLNRVCRMPNVRCAAFREAAAYLDAHPELEGVCDAGREP
jgi:peptidoglycan/xylan/chitin deacetylase (PgdA/CDA1 family)